MLPLHSPLHSLLSILLYLIAGRNDQCRWTAPSTETVGLRCSGSQAPVSLVLCPSCGNLLHLYVKTSTAGHFRTGFPASGLTHQSILASRLNWYVWLEPTNTIVVSYTCFVELIVLTNGMQRPATSLGSTPDPSDNGFFHCMNSEVMCEIGRLGGDPLSLPP